MEQDKIIGQKKDAGFQIGVRKTFDVSIEIVWNFLLSSKGISTWLGEINEATLEEKQNYKTKDVDLQQNSGQ